jgi:hypothetical protein
VHAVAVDDDLVRISYPGGQLLPRYAAPLASLRGITRVAMDGRTVWAAGPGGVLVIGRRDGVARLYATPGDVPDDVTDVLLQDEYGWVATRAGVLRLRRLPDGFPR